MIDASIEGYRAIRNAGHTILPKADENFESTAYRRTCLCFFKLMCATSLGKLCASDHAMNAVDEMNRLNRDMKAFFDANGADYPVWHALEGRLGGICDEICRNAHRDVGAVRGVLPQAADRCIRL